MLRIIYRKLNKNASGQLIRTICKGRKMELIGYPET